MRFLLALLALSSISARSDVSTILPDKRLAYYGNEFYSKKVSKELLFKILNGNHSMITGAPDSIGAACNVSCYRHTSVGYDGARKILFGELYTQSDKQGTFVTDVYCGKKFYFKNIETVDSMHTQINIEHTWPQSKFSSAFDKNTQKSDMHHLYLADTLANNRRGNHDFGEVDENHDELNVSNCSISKLGYIGSQMTFTPPKEHRGNVARALFYFATRYNMIIETSDEGILRQWHKLDPIDTAEKARHEVIAKYQKVRNPYIDFPELVDQISDF